MRVALILLIAAMWITACGLVQDPGSGSGTVPPDTAVTNPPLNEPSVEPVNNPFAPQPADSNLTQVTVFVQETSLVVRESYPPQISLNLSGDLPTPCHELRVQVNEPDEKNNINVDAYSVVDPNLVCIQVLEPFEASIDLGAFPSGH